MLKYWNNYWTDVMGISKHSRYNSVQWINEGEVTEFKPIAVYDWPGGVS